MEDITDLFFYFDNPSRGIEIYFSPYFETGDYWVRVFNVKELDFFVQDTNEDLANEHISTDGQDGGIVFHLVYDNYYSFSEVEARQYEIHLLSGTSFGFVAENISDYACYSSQEVTFNGDIVNTTTVDNSDFMSLFAIGLGILLGWLVTREIWKCL